MVNVRFRVFGQSVSLHIAWLLNCISATAIVCRAVCDVVLDMFMFAARRSSSAGNVCIVTD